MTLFELNAFIAVADICVNIKVVLPVMGQLPVLNCM